MAKQALLHLPREFVQSQSKFSNAVTTLLRAKTKKEIFISTRIMVPNPGCSSLLSRENCFLFTDNLQWEISRGSYTYKSIEEKFKLIILAVLAVKILSLWHSCEFRVCNTCPVHLTQPVLSTRRSILCSLDSFSMPHAYQHGSTRIKSLNLSKQLISFRSHETELSFYRPLISFHFIGFALLQSERTRNLDKEEM